eukprot:Tbor_TRINITY_DN5556_c0_g1::TRINITY_DN5556_c0_g1_i7::g.13855::m.13855
MESGYEGRGSRSPKTRPSSAQSNYGGAGEASTKEGLTANIRSDRAVLATGRKGRRCASTPYVGHEGPRRVHDSNFPSVKNSHMTSLHCRYSPSNLSHNGVSVKPVDIGLPGGKGQKLKEVLRAIDPYLEQRRLRRGRLLFLAAKGWTDVQLLVLSRHATLGMLRRYLDMGTASSTTAQTGIISGL